MSIVSAMTTLFLFICTVLVWGTTWIAIAAQVGHAPIAVSIFYRFALAGMVMLAGLAFLGRLRRPRVWRFVVAQALCLFSLNFFALYAATAYISSGLVSVIFSLASLFNAVNAWLFFGEHMTRQAAAAGMLGVIGLALIFWQDFAIALEMDTLKGIGLAALGTAIFSLGNMASRKNAELEITPVTANAWGMAIGAMSILGLLAATGQPWVLPKGGVYWAALIYLAIIGSVVGFTCYLLLVRRIGSARAGYATVMFPIVALALSTLLEGYQWTPLALIGVLCAGAGNVVMFGSGLFSDRPRRSKWSTDHDPASAVPVLGHPDLESESVAGYGASGRDT